MPQVNVFFDRGDWDVIGPAVCETGVGPLVARYLSGERRIPPASSAGDQTALSNQVIITRRKVQEAVRVTARLAPDDFDRLMEMSDADGRTLGDLVALICLHETMVVMS